MQWLKRCSTEVVGRNCECYLSMIWRNRRVAEPRIESLDQVPNWMKTLSPNGGEGTERGRSGGYFFSGAASGVSCFGVTFTISSLSSTVAVLRISAIFSPIF